MAIRRACALVCLVSGLLMGRQGVGAQGADALSPAASGLANGCLLIENVGQFADVARYQLWRGPATTWLSNDGLWLTLIRPACGDSPVNGAVHLHLTFPGASPHSRLEPFGRADATVSYLLGSDPAAWHSGVPMWRGVRYVDLYPGVDLVVGGEGSATAWLPWHLEAASEDLLEQMRLRVEGAESVSLARQGGPDALGIETALGALSVPLPMVSGAMVRAEPVVKAGTGFEVSAPFVAHGSTAVAGALPADRPQDLRYATLLGGGNPDHGNAIAVDGHGCAYVAGYTASSGFPAANGPGYDTAFSGTSDGYVVKLNAAGTAPVYATFIGGKLGDSVEHVAVDGQGCAYAVGNTSSDDFPATAGPGYDTSYNGGYGDAFLLKLNAAGTGLVYATFLGGTGDEVANGIALDSARCAYVVGRTDSRQLVSYSVPGYDHSYHVGWGSDGFAFKVSAAGTQLVYGTYLGGNDTDVCWAVAVDLAGRAYVTGETNSPDFPAALGPGFDKTKQGSRDAFALKLSSSGTSLHYATYLGGAEWDVAEGIAVDAAGCAYLAGSTSSVDFPPEGTPGFDHTLGGDGDGFVAKLSAAGTSLTWATLLGGSGGDGLVDVAVDSAGRATVVGYSTSVDYPVGPGYDTSYNGDSDTDCVITRLSAAGTAPVYSTYLGTAWNDDAFAVAMDPANDVYVSGRWPYAAPPGDGVPGYDKTPNGTWDAFVAKLRLGDLTGVPRARLPLVQR